LLVLLGPKGTAMKQRIYEDLWRRLGKFAPAEGTEARTEFDGEVDNLAGNIETAIRWALPTITTIHSPTVERDRFFGGKLDWPPVPPPPAPPLRPLAIADNWREKWEDGGGPKI